MENQRKMDITCLWR